MGGGALNGPPGIRAQTLVQITSGIAEAQGQVSKKGGLVNPFFEGFKESGIVGYSYQAGTRAVFIVEFDVAVTTAEGQETTGGGGIRVAAITFGGQKVSEATNSSISRVRFSVPFAPPQQVP